MQPLDGPINVNAMTRKIDVDNRIPLRHYYRIADNLIRQASIYREEKNIIDLYIILLRFCSLLSETIPLHRDYQLLLPKERVFYRRKLYDVIEELERLKADFNRRLDELNKARTRPQLNCLESTSNVSAVSSMEYPSIKNSISSNLDIKQVQLHPASRNASHSSWLHHNKAAQVTSPKTLQIEKQFQKMSLSLPLPKEETLSRHSLLGPSGLHGRWQGPSAGIKVQYPSSADIPSTEDLGLNQTGRDGHAATKDGDPGQARSTMESVLSLDDGRWLQPAEESCSLPNAEKREDSFELNNIWQPSPPPVLAQVQQEFLPIPPSKVADPRPGPAKSSLEGMSDSSSYKHLHIPVKMMEDFLRLAQANTAKNLETCGVLAGSLKNRVFHITTLIIPKQESTSDSCQTMNEEEIFDVQDKLSLFPLGWIHTHPSQTCFMSSVDLHTHYSYQVMLPEAIAIVMAPTDTTRQHGIFHLSDPGGVSVIRNCQQRGFHPHEEPEDGNPIYEHCSHVYMNTHLKCDIVDLR
ncbi:AMSH-like ubiquitin thioesterase 3 [Macadamia integrifolia]|uniref:AMSH-like ubiquitin thioesterase 3 n=1 Tax=Macadamia integrifolia TaxID=60698 RepID=UPI001C4EA310|nr:AMSH-like ubiquitin thioesterase 3 [Macadamia integrifolia]